MTTGAPAVAKPSVHHCTSWPRRQLLGEWLKCAKTCDTCCSNFCPIKASYTFDNFGAVHFLEWVLPLCLRVDWYSGDTISCCFKNSRGGGQGGGGADMLRALFQKHSTHISMRECAAVSLSLDYHRLWAANNSAVKGRGADKGWSGGTPTCYQCSNDGALRNWEKRMQGNTLCILLFWTTKKGWQSRISQGRHEAKTLWRTNWTHISQAHIKPLQYHLLAGFFS